MLLLVNSRVKSGRTTVPETFTFQFKKKILKIFWPLFIRIFEKVQTE